MHGLTTLKQIALFTLASVCAQVVAQAGPDAVIAGENAYLLSYPEVVSQPVVENFQWSSDGQYLLYIRADAPTPLDFKLSFTERTKPPRTVSAVVWNAITKKQSVLWRITGRERVELRAFWLQNSQSVVITTIGQSTNPEATTRVELVRANAASGKADKIYFADTKDGNALFVSPSPVGPIAAIIDHSEEVGESPQGTRIWFITPSRQAPVPVRMPGRVGQLVWDKDGKPSCLVYPLVAQPKPWENFYAINPATGKTSKMATPPVQFDPLPPELAISARPEPTELGTPDSPKKSWNARLLSSKKSRKTSALVAADVSGVRLNSKLDFVAYVSQGVLAVRPIVKMKSSELEDALDAAERELLMSQGKQIGLAALMYAGDWDDVLPSANADIRALILPYCKNTSMLEGFVYTFAGGSLSNIGNPSETELGHIPGKGGRAVIYVDGHVKWVKN